METAIFDHARAEVIYGFLRGPDGDWMELHYSIVPTEQSQIAEQVRAIEDAEKDLMRHLAVSEDSTAFKRLFSSDLISHRDELAQYKQRQSDCFFSVTEQPPASSARLALLGLCLSNITSKHRDGNVVFFDTTSGIRHIFAEHLVDPDACEDSDAERQTQAIFQLLKAELSKHHVSVEDSVLRTWLYTPHVDADYPGIVKARKEFFDSIHLTKDTHYIASTGIQGGTGNRFARVAMDAYAVSGVDSDRIRYIHAPEHLSPTHVYGVTFERATAVEMGQTDFLFISGTASIDRDGQIVHPGDVVKQTERTLDNISALLAASGFNREDLANFIVYLRDPLDLPLVRPLIDRYATDLPAVYVKAPVCRPGWLIEIEAMASKCLY